MRRGTAEQTEVAKRDQQTSQPDETPARASVGPVLHDSLPVVQPKASPADGTVRPELTTPQLLAAAQVSTIADPAVPR
jgi:hypothetical protein